jgi:hypothetical protein
MSGARSLPHPWVQALKLDGRRRIAFLHCPHWDSSALRQVIASYAAAFDAASDTTLVLYLDPTQGVTPETAAHVVESALAESGRTPGQWPDLLLVSDVLGPGDMHRLYAAVDWVVPNGDRASAHHARRSGAHILHDLSLESWRAARWTRDVRLPAPPIAQASPAVSFCIITGGTRPETLRRVIRSIHAQRIPQYEIIVSGVHRGEPDIHYIAREAAARAGRLGDMRNAAVATAQYEYIALLDDDILLHPDWYAALQQRAGSFDILTSQVRLPDGSMYWGHCTIGGPRGHRILADFEEDAYTYMTGGGGWVMTSEVARNAQWNSDLPFYNGEDVDFARTCQAYGFTISHEPGMVVFHGDAKYTGVGRWVWVRKEWLSHDGVRAALENKSALELLQMAQAFINSRQIAEAADCVRFGLDLYPSHPDLSLAWRAIEDHCGGSLPMARWYPSGDPVYQQLAA